MLSKDVLVIMPFGNVLNNPTSRALIEFLKSSGYYVTLSCRRNRFLSHDLDLYHLKEMHFLWGALKYMVYKYFPAELLFNFFAFCEYYKRRRGYEFIISVDTQGALEGAAVAKLLELPHHHISYEIMFSDEVRLFRKLAEKKALRNVKSVLVQDSARAHHFCVENNVPKDKIFLIPLAERANTSFPDKAIPSHIVRDLVRENKKIIAFIGSITLDFGLRQAIALLSALPADYVLLLNPRFGSLDPEIISTIEESDVSARIFINSAAEPDINSLGRLLSSCALGVAFYYPSFDNEYNGKNIEYIGMASGKAATYLRHGVPVITNTSSRLYDFLIENGIGLGLDDVLEQPDRLNGLKKKSQIVDCFNRKLAFENFEQELSKRLNLK